MNEEEFLDGLDEDRLYFRIGEVSEILDESPSTLRYWEQSVDSLDPRTTSGGERRYDRGDLRIMHSMKKLVREEKFTVEGARKHLRERTEKQSTVESGREIQKLADEAIREINEFMETM
ncbi:MAG: MerR family transcriptional regulator [bacterium]